MLGLYRKTCYRDTRVALYVNKFYVLRVYAKKITFWIPKNQENGI